MVVWTGIAVGFLALSIAVWFVRPAPLKVDQTALDDPRIRDRVVDLFASRVGGTYDSHNDPDVGRVLQKNLVGREHGSVTIDTNRFGLREREYPLPKNMELKLFTAQKDLVDDKVGSIRFYPDGGSNGGRITLGSGDRKFEVDVDWLTGRVAILD